MIRIYSGPAVCVEATVASREDPLVRLLDTAYRRLTHRENQQRAGLLVAGDGSKLGQQRVFEKAAVIHGSLPPRLIPHRLSNGAASWLAIEHGHTGRVLTFPDGPGSIVRALHFLVTSIEAGLAPADWVFLAGRVDHFEGTSARGVAVALVAGLEGGRGTIEVSPESDGDAAARDPIDIVAELSAESGAREAILTSRADRGSAFWTVRIALGPG